MWEHEYTTKSIYTYILTRTHTHTHTCHCISSAIRCYLCKFECAQQKSANIISKIRGCPSKVCLYFVIKDFNGVLFHKRLLLRHTVTHYNKLATHCNTLQHTATHCNTLQHTATHCNTLQHTKTHCNKLVTDRFLFELIKNFHWNATATYWNTLHSTATQLQHTCNTVQHNITQCNTLATHL